MILLGKSVHSLCSICKKPKGTLSDSVVRNDISFWTLLSHFIGMLNIARRLIITAKGVNSVTIFGEISSL